VLQKLSKSQSEPGRTCKYTSSNECDTKLQQ
jgi:hypothetical protein